MNAPAKFKAYNADEVRSLVEDLSYGVKMDDGELQVLALYIEVAEEEINSMRAKLQQITNLNPNDGDCIVKIEYLGLSPLAQMMLGDEVHAGHLRVEFRRVTKEFWEQIQAVLSKEKSEGISRKGVEFYPIVTETPIPAFVNKDRLTDLLKEWEENSVEITPEQLDQGF